MKWTFIVIPTFIEAYDVRLNQSSDRSFVFYLLSIRDTTILFYSIEKREFDVTKPSSSFRCSKANLTVHTYNGGGQLFDRE